MLYAALSSASAAFNPLKLFEAPPPPPPPPPPSSLPLSPVTLTAVALCWLLPAFLLVSQRHAKVSAAAKTTLDGTGKEVPKDVIRRQAALAAKTGPSMMDTVLQFGVWFGLTVPMAWVFATQENPTAGEQIAEWASLSWAQLTNGQLTLNFQVAAFLLFIERATYTWVHTFSASFIRFANSRVGKALGEKPLDVVLNLFFINKTVQMGTFIGWYFYIIDFESPFAHGYAWSEVTRLQWVLLGEAMIVGQGLNTAIYATIGKAGVYYGYRLGVDVPWVIGFPFNVGIPHPQYIGACLTCFGVNAWCGTRAHLEAGWLNLTAIQVLYYVYMGLVEDYL